MRVFVLVSAIICTLFAAALVPWLVPASFLLNVTGEGNLKPLAGARLVEGQGLWATESGTVLASWRWCPGQGLTSLCLTGSGPGFFKAVLTPAIQGIRLGDVTFDGVDGKAIGLDAAVLAVTAPNDGAQAIRLGGRIEEAILPWGSSCLGLALPWARGEVTIAGLSLPGNASGSLQLQLNGSGRKGGELSLAGEGVNGTFTADSEEIRGSLVFDGSLVPENARPLFATAALTDGNYRLDISRRLCP